MSGPLLPVAPDLAGTLKSTIGATEFRPRWVHPELQIPGTMPKGIAQQTQRVWAFGLGRRTLRSVTTCEAILAGNWFTNVFRLP